MKTQNKRENILTRWFMIMAVFVLPAIGLGQYYQVGDNLSQTTLNRTVFSCANGAGNTTLGSYFVPDQGEPSRVVWLTFFASW